MMRGLFYGIGIIGAVSLVIIALAARGNAQFDTQQTLHQYCSSDTTLHVLISENRTIDGETSLYQKESDTICTNGCDSVTNQCSPNFFEANAITVAAIVVFIVVVIVLLGWMLK